MNWLRKLILGKQISAQLEAKALNQFPQFIVNNGQIVQSRDNKQQYIDEGYNVNEIIYSVIALILDKVRLPEWTLMKIVDETKLKQRNSMMRNKNLSSREWKQVQQLTKEALEPITSFNLATGKLKELLKYPNECDTFQELIAFGHLDKLLTGDIFWWGDLLGRGANGGIPNSLWALPSQHMIIRASGTFPQVPESYELQLWNLPFTKQSVLHEKYPNPNQDTSGQGLYGFAPLRAFRTNTIRNNSAKIAATSKFKNGGIEELLYVDDQRWTPEEGAAQAEAVKARLSSPEYRGEWAQGKFAISGIRMGSVKLGMSPVDLGITESEKWDAIMACNIYGVPPELLGLTQKTYNNAKEAEKALTTRSAIPLLNATKNAFNRKIQTDWGFKDQNIYIDYETECFSELHADQNETAAWLDKVMLITPDEQREFLNMDALNIPESQEVWVKTGNGYQPLTDFQANEVDQTLNDMVNQINQNNLNANQKPPAQRVNGNGVAQY